MRFILLLLLLEYSYAQYQPDWSSLDNRPLPKWYDQSKFGIFVHWGVFSVPSFGGLKGDHAGEWYWYYYSQNTTGYHEFQKTYGENFQYQDFANEFNAKFFDPNEWATIFKNSGAKYVVLTSKHHEGWCNFPTSASWNWNSVDAGPHRDLVGDLTTAVKSIGGVHMGLYHSLFEWFNPLFLQDQANHFNTTIYVDQVLLPELKQIVNKYEPDVIWADGDWSASDKYWKSKEFLAWLYNSSPVKDSVVVNDRWGSGDACKHGGYYTCNDRYNPGHLVQHKWENCMTIDSASWGWSRTSPLSNYLSLTDLIYELLSTVAYGGNLLLNVGPTADGRIPIIFQDRLKGIGNWLDINGDGIYETTPWSVAQNQTQTIFYTKGENAVYAHVIDLPTAQDLTLLAPRASNQTAVYYLSRKGPQPLKFKFHSSGGLDIAIPAHLNDVARPAVTLKLADLLNF